MKWPDVQERLEASGPPLVEGLLLLVVPTFPQVGVVLLVIEPEVEEAEQPRVFVALAQLVCPLLEWPARCAFGPLVRVSAAVER